MEPGATLFNPSGRPITPDPAHTCLFFTPDDFHNTKVTLSHGNGDLAYTVESPPDRSWTEIRDAEGASVVKVEYHSLRSDKAVVNRKEMKMKEWMVDWKNFPLTMLASDGSQYTYKSDSYGRVALYRTSDSSSSNPSPLAWYNHKSANDSPSNASDAYLAFVPEVEHIRTEVLAGMLVVQGVIFGRHTSNVSSAGMHYSAGVPTLATGGL